MLTLAKRAALLASLSASTTELVTTLFELELVETLPVVEMAGALVTSANLAARLANFSAISGSIALLLVVVVVAVVVVGLLVDWDVELDGVELANDLNRAALASSTDWSLILAFEVLMTI